MGESRGEQGAVDVIGHVEHQGPRGERQMLFHPGRINSTEVDITVRMF